MSHEFYGNAVVAGGELSAADVALLDNTATVRDGDDIINIDGIIDHGNEDLGQDGKGTKVGDVIDADDDLSDDDADTETTPVVAPELQSTEEQILAGMRAQQEGFQDAAAKASAAGLDPVAIVNEFNAAGALSEATYVALEGAGFSRAITDSIIAGQLSQMVVYNNAIYAEVGGKAEFDKLAAWATANAAEDAAAFSEASNDGKLGQAKSILRALKAAQTKALGTRNKGLQGTKPVDGNGSGKGTTKAEPFADVSAMMAAMSDKKYGRDAKYTASVEARVAVTQM
ncbi:head assembly [Ralstonia phage RPSC1]|uniref:Putative capsid assembly protein n=1 Tax=Ralstonia phage RPSC1 TaxID=2041351 RepID=A0A2Z2UBX8_9CAUD|nr:head assembly [Ralstonia phage RPSC1]ATN92972.1 putative capsid assembly protein [Ralstonia phage RPSC1]